MNWILAMVVMGTMLLVGTTSLGDVGAPDNPYPPWEDNDDCWYRDGSEINQVLDGYRCEECVRTKNSGPPPTECEHEWEEQGYSLVCGSRWTEIWCCATGDAGVCSPNLPVPKIDSVRNNGDNDGGDGCSVIAAGRSASPLLLAIVMLAIGLVTMRKGREL